MRVLVTGANGMVGRAVADHCRRLGDDVRAYAHSDLDIVDHQAVTAVVDSFEPDTLINCAAWTDVDGCEFDPEKARRANAIGPENLARACCTADALLVTISTDYVFDGDKEGFYTERDEPDPKSVYGISKLEGERMAQAAHSRTIIVRSGFIFGPGGKNFLSTIIRRARAGETLTAISDAWGTPTYALHLAARLRDLAQLDRTGILHVVNSGEGASYEEFARAAIEEVDLDKVILKTVAMQSLNRPAPRPRNSRLSSLVSGQWGLPPLPHWRDALHEYASLGKAPEDLGADFAR